MNRYLLKFMCFFMALFAAHQVNAATVFVKGNNSPYVKVGDNYQKAEASVQTSDGVTWYYTDVADNSTISFATANNGSNISPEFTIGSGEAYFFYNGSAYAINMTAMKDAQSYLLLEVTTNNWDKDGASFWIWNGQDNVKLTYTGGDKWGKNVYLYKTDKNTSGTFYFKRCGDNNPNNTWNEFSYDYTKGGYYKATDGNSGELLTSVSEYKNVVWPEKPAPVVNALKHNWGNKGWSWKDLDENNSVVAVYHSNYGVDYGYKNGDSYTQIAYIQPNDLIKVGDPQNDDECTFTFNPTNNTVTVTKAAEKWIDKVYILGVNNDWTNGTEVGSFHGVYTYNYTASNTDTKKHWAYRVIYNDGSTKYFTPNNAGGAIALDATQNYTVKDARGDDSWYCEAITAGCSYNIVLNTNDGTVKIVRTGGVANEIPVYPKGISTEAEIANYDFDANPAVYLRASKLNNGRVTPEWQMEKRADGKYHLDGFAMRYCEDVRVSTYTNNGHTTSANFKSTGFPDGMAEGKLCNATWDPATGELSLEVASDKMPFVSLVGYAMQQDQVYQTPRHFDGTPEETATSKGWQEAWILYDEQGNIVKDRKGNVMYNTMWPPKNPVYFTANVGDETRMYTSDQMTFRPYDNYVVKTGAEWKALLTDDEYKNLGIKEDVLVDNARYARYIVNDLWFVGSAKVWTGWAGQVIGSNQMANWSDNTNWGYKKNKNTDTDGTAISPETTYYLSHHEGYNGNFLFNEPTYFKTIEMFYNLDKIDESRIYTTLAFGSAQIEAKSHKDGDSYDHGMFNPTINPTEGWSLKNYTIKCYNATTGEFVKDVKSGTTDLPTDWTNDATGLTEGKYYYEMVVTFSNTNSEIADRTATVKSNPFIIYFPGTFVVSPQASQLVKLNTPASVDEIEYNYVTVSSNANTKRFYVNLEGSSLSSYTEVPSTDIDAINTKVAKNEGIKWTDRTLVYVPVPTSFKQAAEKAEATVSLEGISNYVINGDVITSLTEGKDVVKIYSESSRNFSDKLYNAVMNYTEQDPETHTSGQKTSLGNNVALVMQRPDVEENGDVAVEVTRSDNAEELSILDGEEVKQAETKYYSVNVTVAFNDPNIECATAPVYRVKVGETEKFVSPVGTGIRKVTLNNVDPTTVTENNVKVNAMYSDGTSYSLPATIGEGVDASTAGAAFQKRAWPQINSVRVVRSKVLKDGSTTEHKPVVFITAMSTKFDGGDKIGNTKLDADCIFNVDFTIDNQDAPAYSKFLDLDDIDFVGKLQIVDKHHVWSKFIQFDNTSGKTEEEQALPFKAAVTPVYVAKVTNTQTTENLEEATVVTAAPAEAAYVALRGNEDVYELGQIYTGINDVTTSDAPKARKVIENGQVYIICGERKFNVMGAEIK